MAWLAAILPALAQIGGAVAQNQAAGAKPSQQQVPLPPYQEALQAITARALALNMMQTPPSFIDWVNSGGQAKFPMVNPGITPKGARDLGIVSQTGGPVPFTYAPGGTPVGALDLSAGTGQAPPGGLSDTQRLYLGMQEWRGGNRDTALAKAWHAHQLQKQIAQRVSQLTGREEGAPAGKVIRIEKQKSRLQHKAAKAKQHEIDLFGHALPGETGFDDPEDFTVPFSGGVGVSGQPPRPLYNTKWNRGRR